MLRDACKLLIVFWAGCSGNSGTPQPDASVEGDAADLAVDANETVDAGPALPQLQDWKCPTGWARTTVGEGLEVSHEACLPPEQLVCPNGQAQFLGETACRRIGTVCPTGDFADEASIRKLAPAFSGKILYVKPGVPLGDGSRTNPMATVNAALLLATDGDLVVLARGIHQGRLAVKKQVALVGSCVNETVLTATNVSEMQGIVLLEGGAMVTNLRITGPGIGIDAGNQTKPVTVVAVEVVESQSIGIMMNGVAGGELTEVVIRDTKSRSDKTLGNGLMILEGAKVSVSRLLIERARDFGLAVGYGAEAALTDVVVRDTLSQETRKDSGRGLHLQDGGRATIERGLFERNRDAAASAWGQGVQLVLTDVVVRDTLGREKDKRFGSGLEVVDGAAVEVTRGVFDRNRAVAVNATSNFGEVGKAPPTLQLTDVLIRDTQPQESDNTWGAGLYVGKGAKVEVSRAFLARNRSVGIMVGTHIDQAPTLALADVVVSDTKSDAKLFSWGQGLSVQDAAELTAERVALIGNRQAALHIGNSRDNLTTSATLTDLTILRTTQAACGALAADHPGRCVEGQTSYAGGNGLVVAGKASVQVTSFEIGHSLVCGIQVVRDAQVKASDGRVHHNAIGLNVQSEDYDLDTITNETVRYHDNDSNLVSDKLPVPEPPLFR